MVMAIAAVTDVLALGKGARAAGAAGGAAQLVVGGSKRAHVLHAARTSSVMKRDSMLDAAMGTALRERRRRRRPGGAATPASGRHLSIAKRAFNSRNEYRQQLPLSHGLPNVATVG